VEHTPPRSGDDAAGENAARAFDKTVGNAGHTARRRVLQAALAAGPVILTLKAGPARAATTSAMASASHISHAAGELFTASGQQTEILDTSTGGETYVGGTGSESPALSGATQSVESEASSETCTTVTKRKWRWRVVSTESAGAGGREGSEGGDPSRRIVKESYYVTTTRCGGERKRRNRYRDRLRWARLHNMMGGERMRPRSD
jgi:hypothetical protein